MNKNNKIIIALFIVGIILFSLVQFVFIPHNNKQKKVYVANQKDAVTHDLNSILKYKNKYMGNASNIINLYYNLPLSDVGAAFEIYPNELKFEVNYKETIWNIGEEKVEKSLIYNSTAAFALIDNLESILYNFPGKSYEIKREDIKKLYDNFDNILKEENWKKGVQQKLNDEKYIEKNFKYFKK